MHFASAGTTVTGPGILWQGLLGEAHVRRQAVCTERGQRWQDVAARAYGRHERGTQSVLRAGRLCCSLLFAEANIIFLQIRLLASVKYQHVVRYYEAFAYGKLGPQCAEGSTIFEHKIADVLLLQGTNCALCKR